MRKSRGVDFKVQDDAKLDCVVEPNIRIKQGLEGHLGQETAQYEADFMRRIECSSSLHSSDEFRLFGELTSTLHSGEVACLSIAAHRQWTFLSDDKAARRAGVSLNIPMSGTLGVLLALVKHGQLALTEADTMLMSMVQAGYFSPVFSLREILSR